MNWQIQSSDNLPTHIDVWALQTYQTTAPGGGTFSSSTYTVFIRSCRPRDYREKSMRRPSSHNQRARQGSAGDVHFSSPSSSLRRRMSPFVRGACVVVSGITSRPELNDQHGWVCRELRCGERCEVVLETGECFSLRLTNLTPAEPLVLSGPSSVLDAGSSGTMPKALATTIIDRCATHGWDRTRRMAMELLKPFKPCLSHAKLSHPGAVLAKWEADDVPLAKGSHAWALGVLAALLETVHRADDRAALSPQMHACALLPSLVGVCV